MLAADPSSWIPGAIASSVSAIVGMLAAVGTFVTLARRQRATHEDVVCTRLRRVFEGFHNGMMVVDRDLIILMANKQARAITGYGSDLVGKSIYDLIPQELRDKHREHVRRFFADPHTRRMGGDQKFPMIDRYGTKMNLKISLSPAENEYGSIETTVGMDVVQE